MRAEFRVSLWSDSGEKFFGEGPYRLLLGIDRLGSLNAAAKELGMAYSKAYYILRRAERLLGEALTQRYSGGSGGGGSALTLEARTLISRYEALKADCAAALAESFARNFVNRPALGCAVLAAGSSQRFGANKLLARLGDEPVLAHTLKALPRECFCRILAVVSDPRVEALCRERGVEVHAYSGGPLSASIREALVGMHGTDGCMFVNGDQPLIESDSLRRMAAAFAETPDCAIRLAFGNEAASPVIVPASAYPAMAALEGERGGMTVLRSGPWEIRRVEAKRAVELWDADDEAALRRLEDFL